MANLGVVIYVLIAIALGVLTWRKPAAALVALMCVQVLDFWGQLSSPLLYKYSLVTNLYVAALVCGSALRVFIFSSVKPYGNATGRTMVIVFWVYAFVSLAWSPATTQGLGEWRQFIPYMIFTLIMPLCLRKPEDLHDSLFALAIVGAVLVILTDVFVKWDERYVVSFWDSSIRLWNALAFADLAGYVGLAAILLHFPRRTLWVLFRIATIVACMILAVKSGTRGQFGLTVLLPIILLPLCIRMKNVGSYFLFIFLAAVVIGGAVWALATFGVQKGLEDRWSSHTLDSDLMLRWQMAQRLLDVWWEQARVNPITLLVGLGNSASFSKDISGFYTHVMAAEVLGEEGIFGLIILVLILMLFLSRFRAVLRRTTIGTPARNSAVTTAAFFLFVFILSFKQGSLDSCTADLFLPFLLLEQQLRLLSRRAPSKQRIPISIASPMNDQFKNTAI